MSILKVPFETWINMLFTSDKLKKLFSISYVKIAIWNNFFFFLRIHLEQYSALVLVVLKGYIATFSTTNIKKNMLQWWRESQKNWLFKMVKYIYIYFIKSYIILLCWWW